MGLLHCGACLSLYEGWFAFENAPMAPLHEKCHCTTVAIPASQVKNNAVAKEKLLSEVWGAFSEVEPSTLTVHIRWLREKLESDPANPQYIKTVYKVGYMLEVKE